MTNNRGLVNLRIMEITVIAASLVVVTAGSQNAMASIIANCPPQCTPGGDILIEEEEEAEAEAGNATMTAGATNQSETTNGNMTGTNSTS